MPDFDSLEEMAEATAANLDQAASNAAFQLFQDRKFRRLARLEQLSQTEQDRIFNELLVSYLVLIMLLLEAPDLRVDDEVREFVTNIARGIPLAHIDQLRALGIEEAHLRDWSKLISMRHEEYTGDRTRVRAAAMQIEAAEKPLDQDGLDKIHLTLPAQTVAIGCHRHVCRGQLDGRDELFKTTLDALGRFYLELRVHLEAGKITPFMRARVAVKRTLRRLRKKKR